MKPVEQVGTLEAVWEQDGTEKKANQDGPTQAKHQEQTWRNP